MRFDGKTALVTGASRGIGRAIAVELGRAGASVVVGYFPTWRYDSLAALPDGAPKLEDIAPYVEDSGEGRWTINEAINESVPAPVIAASLFARFASRDEIKFSAKVAAALRNQFGGHAVKAVESAKAGQDPR